jgi:anti-anti-sigma regulatory factor
MIIQETSNGDIAILALYGRLDEYSVVELKQNRSVLYPDTMVVIDLEHVETVDEEGLEDIIYTLRHKSQASAVSVPSGDKPLRKFFETTNTNELIQLFDGIDPAIKYLETWQREHS